MESSARNREVNDQFSATHRLVTIIAVIAFNPELLLTLDVSPLSRRAIFTRWEMNAKLYIRATKCKGKIGPFNTDPRPDALYTYVHYALKTPHPSRPSFMMARFLLNHRGLELYIH